MPVPEAVDALLRLPACGVALFVLLWANTWAALCGYVPIWRLRGARNDTYGVCRFLADFFRVRLVRAGRGSLHRGGPCMYLCNHRSWADFFLDLLVLEGRAATLSRLAVLFVFPTTLLSSMALRALILFKRGRIRDKEAFNRWLDARRRKTPYPGLLVYPEGHRSTGGASLPLKRGMLRYAFDRRLPVQLVISGNKDAVIAEKRLSVRWRQTVVVTYSDLIDPAAFPDFEAFMGQVQAVWDAQWAQADTAEFEGLPPLPPPDSPIAYSLGIKLRQAAVVLFWIAVLLGAVLPATLRTALWALRAAGPVCTALLAAWLAASLAYCSRPVDVRAGRGLPLAGRESAAPALAAAPRGAVEGKEPAAAPAADAEEYATAEE